MNCGLFTSLGLILLAGLAFFGIATQETVTVEPSLPPVAVTAVVEPGSMTSTGEILCKSFPSYCVPLVGGGEGVFAQNETPDTRDNAVPVTSVVRGITGDGSFFIGNPDAPIRFKVFHNFGCSHCRNFHTGDLGAFIESHVVTGQAVLESDLMDFGTPPYPTEAAYAAMCAGEQGAYWEMQALLYENPAQISLDEIVGLAEDIGLQGAALRDCIESDRYAAGIEIYNMLALDLSVTGTPTVFVSYGDGKWTMTNRSYDNLVTLTEAANTQ
jgi:protein-disulfide isomerase